MDKNTNYITLPKTISMEQAVQPENLNAGEAEAAVSAIYGIDNAASSANATTTEADEYIDSADCEICTYNEGERFDLNLNWVCGKCADFFGRDA